MKTIKIVTEYITLGQFLKYIGEIGSGATAKQFLLDNIVLINGEREQRRGRKIYPSYIIRIDKVDYQIGNGL
ncbi:MAG: S4 domain-containing protein YaaA [Bacilli bacterium]|nr:S4 domain-containing protein YaaA [Bacilli bacterium]